MRPGSLVTRANRGGAGGRAGLSLDEVVEKQRERRDFKEAAGQARQDAEQEQGVGQGQVQGEGQQRYTTAALQPGGALEAACASPGMPSAAAVTAVHPARMQAETAGLVRSASVDSVDRVRRVGRTQPRLEGIAEQGGLGEEGVRLGLSVRPSDEFRPGLAQQHVPAPRLQVDTHPHPEAMAHFNPQLDYSPNQYTLHCSPAVSQFGYCESLSPAQGYPPHDIGQPAYPSNYLATPQTVSNAVYSSGPRPQYLALPQEGTPMLYSPRSVSSGGDHFSHAYEQGYGGMYGGSEGYAQQ